MYNILALQFRNQLRFPLRLPGLRAGSHLVLVSLLIALLGLRGRQTAAPLQIHLDLRHLLVLRVVTNGHQGLHVPVC